MGLSGEDPQLVDLVHVGREHAVGAWLVGETIVDPGPSSCLPRLLAALEQRGRAPRALALTHIHLDHAGAAGTLAARFPELEVWVHERGAPHLADPSKLLASATRLYGEEMERLWGEVLAVPAERLRVLRGGERVGDFEVAYTPGHAHHHVAYRHEPTGWAFTGDVAGVRIDGGPVLAPTPPPDIDLAAWRESIGVLEAWRPSALAVTHFGSYADVADHLRALRAHLEEIERWAQELDEAAYVATLAERAAAGGRSYSQTMPPSQGYQGMRRYLEHR